MRADGVPPYATLKGGGALTPIVPICVWSRHAERRQTFVHFLRFDSAALKLISYKDTIRDVIKSGVQQKKKVARSPPPFPVQAVGAPLITAQPD